MGRALPLFTTMAMKPLLGPRSIQCSGNVFDRKALDVKPIVFKGVLCHDRLDSITSTSTVSLSTMLILHARTSAITATRREIFHVKTPHFTADVNRLVRRPFFRDGRIVSSQSTIIAVRPIRSYNKCGLGAKHEKSSDSRRNC